MLKILMMFLVKFNSALYYSQQYKSKHHTRAARLKLPNFPLPCSLLPHTAPCHSFSPLCFVYVWMHLKYERLIQQRGKRKGDQPAHVERHGCSLMWLQLGSPGPNEVLWSSAAPSPIAYTPAAHILPRLHHSGSLRRCSQIALGILQEKNQKKKKKNSPQDWHTGVWMRTTLQSAAATPCIQHTHIDSWQTFPWPTFSSNSSTCLSKERCSSCMCVYIYIYIFAEMVK